MKTWKIVAIGLGLLALGGLGYVLIASASPPPPPPPSGNKVCFNYIVGVPGGDQTMFEMPVAGYTLKSLMKKINDTYPDRKVVSSVNKYNPDTKIWMSVNQFGIGGDSPIALNEVVRIVAKEANICVDL